MDDACLQILTRDLTTFADPGTTIDTTKNVHSIKAHWLQSGQDREAVFNYSPASGLDPDSVVENDQEIPYGRFLAGPSMADLLGVARNIVNVIEPASNYVSLDAQREGDPVHPPMRGSQLILNLAQPGQDRTEVVFVVGDAGIGKTTLLRQIARDAAVRYLHGQNTRLWLYVDAQGRRLAQLDEAIAAELDDVRAKFSYHAVLALVRTGVLVLVVDVFDELIGSVGSYDEAFSSLGAFINDLSGSGALVVAARSAYYEQEFLTRTSTVIGFGLDSWRLQAVRLQEWDDNQRMEYLQGAAKRQGGDAQRQREHVSRALTLLDSGEVHGVSHKPLFVVKTFEIVSGETAMPEMGEGLLSRLVAAYVSREVLQKLKSPVDQRPILTEAQYQELLAELAEEMWRQEARELSRTSIREIARIMGELFELSADHRSELVERLPYAALLGRGGAHGSVAFEHDIFYSYFLSEPLAEAWLEGDARKLARLLRRGHMPEEAAALCGRKLVTYETQRLLDLASSAVSTVSEDPEQVRRNAGSVVAAVLRDREHNGLVIQNLTVGALDLGNTTLKGSTIKNCSFHGTNLAATKLRRCSAQNILFDRILVDPTSTRLEIEGVTLADFVGLGKFQNSTEEQIFSPKSMQDVLFECGLPSAERDFPIRQVKFEVVAVVERLCRLYARTNSLTESDDAMQPIVADGRWKDIRAALLSSGILTTEVRQASGNKVFLKRHVRPDDLLAGFIGEGAGHPQAVWDFWSIMEQRFPATVRLTRRG